MRHFLDATGTRINDAPLPLRLLRVLRPFHSICSRRRSDHGQSKHNHPHPKPTLQQVSSLPDVLCRPVWRTVRTQADSDSNLFRSCVKTIQETLSELKPAPYEIRTSIVHQSVYVEHDPALAVEDIRDALDAAGFDLVSTPVLEQYRLRRTNSSLSSLNRIISRKQEKHAESCLLCQREPRSSMSTAVDGTHAHDAETLVDRRRLGALSPISSLNLDISSTVLHEPPLPQPQPSPTDEGPYHVALSVGGMTCASCIGNVTNALTEIPGISSVAVNLVGKSATATIDKKDLLDQITEAVSDAGYECEVVSVEPVRAQNVVKLKSPIEKREKRSSYRVSFSVGGMTCASCVGNVTNAVEDVEGVSDVAVNLVGKSATAVLQDKDLVKQFINAVEDGGYEAELISLHSIREDNESTLDVNGPRTVALKVEGMFCEYVQLPYSACLMLTSLVSKALS